jgi:subfamily B ATP-binding cassette protein MsbA
MTPSISSPASPRRSLRAFLKPYRSTLSLASGLTLVETLLDLARPWPLKVAVDNAIGGRPLGGPLFFLDRLGPAGLAVVAALGGIALVGIGALVGYLITYLTSATAERVGPTFVSPCSGGCSTSGCRSTTGTAPGTW